MTRHVIETAVVAAAAVLVSYLVSFLLTRRAADDYARHFVRRAGLGFGFFAAGRPLDEAGIPIASSTVDLTITAGSGRTTRESSRSG